MPKRIMRKFKILEISSCDRPAQEGARALIMKRHTEGIEKMSRAGGDTMDADEEFPNVRERKREIEAAPFGRA